MPRPPRGTASFLVASVLLLGAAVFPGTLARFVDTPNVPGNVFQTRTCFGSHVVSGSYLGNGNDNRAITGVGLAPDLVIVKSRTTGAATSRTSTMVGDVSKALVNATALNTNRIQSLDANGFTVGTNNTVNSNGVTYSFVALKSCAGTMSVGTYTGNGTASRALTGLGFSPDYVLVLPANGNAVVQRGTGMPASFRFDQTAAGASDVLSLDADGFTVGNGTEVNQNTIAYHYVAWNAAPGQVSIGSYTGNGVDNRAITTPGFSPEWTVVRRATNGNNPCDRAAHRTSDLVGDNTLNFASAATFADGIQALQATGFQVGTNCQVNTNASTYYFAAFNDF